MSAIWVCRSFGTSRKFHSYVIDRLRSADPLLATLKSFDCLIIVNRCVAQHVWKIYSTCRLPTKCSGKILCTNIVQMYTYIFYIETFLVQLDMRANKTSQPYSRTAKCDSNGFASLNNIIGSVAYMYVTKHTHTDTLQIGIKNTITLVTTHLSHLPPPPPLKYRSTLHQIWMKITHALSTLYYIVYNTFDTTLYRFTICVSMIASRVFC